MTLKDFKEQFCLVEGSFNDLSVFDFCGVYLIINPNSNDEIVYIGSAYSRTIEERLTQYTKVNDTGNSLMHAICRKELECKTVNDITDKKKEIAVNKIKTFKIAAIKHEDLEYRLIKTIDPIYNTAGKDISTES